MDPQIFVALLIALSPLHTSLRPALFFVFVFVFVLFSLSSRLGSLFSRSTAASSPVFSLSFSHSSFFRSMVHYVQNRAGVELCGVGDRQSDEDEGEPTLIRPLPFPFLSRSPLNIQNLGLLGGLLLWRTELGCGGRWIYTRRRRRRRTP